jgi:hypothetical protein
MAFSIFREKRLSLLVGFDYCEYRYFFAKAIIVISRLSLSISHER